jgi:hypothetical protein
MPVKKLLQHQLKSKSAASDAKAVQSAEALESKKKKDLAAKELS